MLIYVNDILANDMISFESKYGIAYGSWKDKLKPQKGNYYVEIDYSGVLNTSDIMLINVESYEIYVYEKKIQLKGKVIDCDNNYIVLGIEDDYINFETDDSVDTMFFLSKYVMITLDMIDIYDEHII